MPSAKPGYHALHQKLRGPLGLKTPIQIVPDTRWFFDHRPERKTIIIHAPPFHPDHHAPVFVHYLGHARLLQDGWPRMQATIEGDKEILDYLQELPQEQREQVPLYWASRSEDSFFDFFVWRFVSEQLGTDWLHRFLNASSASTTEQLLRFFGEKRSVGLDLHRYVYCLDWFAMLPTLAKHYRLPVLAKLNAQMRAILEVGCWSPQFRKKIHTIIPKLRRFYDDLFGRYADHEAFLESSQTWRTVFSRYYGMVWQGLPLKVKIVLSGKNTQIPGKQGDLRETKRALDFPMRKAQSEPR